MSKRAAGKLNKKKGKHSQSVLGHFLLPSAEIYLFPIPSFFFSFNQLILSYPQTLTLSCSSSSLSPSPFWKLVWSRGKSPEMADLSVSFCLFLLTIYSQCSRQCEFPKVACSLYCNQRLRHQLATPGAGDAVSCKTHCRVVRSWERSGVKVSSRRFYISIITFSLC